MLYTKSFLFLKKFLTFMLQPIFLYFLSCKNFKKSIDKILYRCYNFLVNLNITKNDYDEDGRSVKLYRELSGGARQ